MIQELWDYLTTTTSSAARKEGYLYHSIALAHRARRCRQHWSAHLEMCRTSISKRMKQREKGGTLAILGSGLLLETPLDILLPEFDRIDLVDVVHTKDVRKSISNFQDKDKIHFIEMDLNKQAIESKYDFVISANLLSQLPYVIVGKLREGRKATVKLEEEAQRITKDLQARHLQQICELSSERLLLSDFELKAYDLQGKLIETCATVDSGLNVSWSPTWAWKLAPAPELSKDYSVELTVGIAKL
jgi:hypothetical protein